ncbi:MAG: ABC transporter ATP-binding protein [Actinomycetota bacterium]|nr:ABC transporter ATP-binding protein [Actinomycetota bacterium]
MTDAVLSVRDLHVRFGTRRGVASVVNGVSWDVSAGQTLAIVGESGSGKSVSTMAVVGLVPQPPARIEGSARFEGRQLVGAAAEELRRVRGGGIGLVFQDPMTSLNPVMSVGRQIGESLELHVGLRGDALRRRAVELLDHVGIPSPDTRVDDYPHQFSGGMRQRVMIAMALAGQPKVLIADEPTTALDVTTQAQIVELVAKLQEDFGTAVVWITHDLGVVAGIADRVLVMYAGEIVEDAPVDALYDSPRHPYTIGLLGSLPSVAAPGADLATIPGTPPDPRNRPPGCAFYPRCNQRMDARCATERPPLREVAPGHWVRTFYDADASRLQVAS